MNRSLTLGLSFLGSVSLFVCLSAAGQEARNAEQAQQPALEVYIPKDLEDCFGELERILKPEDVQTMREGTEEDMIRYHHGLGTWIRNNWGLWGGSRLSKWFDDKGIRHPETMSGIILDSFWRHLHGKDIDLDGQIRTYHAAVARQLELRKQEHERAKRAAQRIDEMVIGMSLERVQAPPVRLPPRTNGGLRARYLARYGGGVLLAIRQGSPEAFTTPGYFLDLQHRSLHPIRVPEIEEIHSAVVAGGVAYFSGVSRGIPLLIGVSGPRRSQLTLPNRDTAPTLGLDGSKLLAVYGKEIYREEGGRWIPIYRGEIDLPRSGRPPQRFGHQVFFRDEGEGENEKRLWWLDLGSKPGLVSLDDDVGVVGPQGPRWENSFSYCVTREGVLWATLGEGYAQKSLIQRSPGGEYALAVVNNSLRFDGELLGSESNDDGLDTSAVALDANGRLIAGGSRGLYAIAGNQFRQFVSFENTEQAFPTEDGGSRYHWSWDLSDILDLDEGRYLLSGTFGGIYLLERDAAGEYRFTSLDEHIGAPVTF